MLHEILLSLSGHPSPLLRTAQAADPDGGGGGNDASLLLITAPERALLAGVAHLSDLHVRLRTSGAQVAASHPSAICRAVAAAVEGTHLAAFQRKVLDVEAGVLRRDAGLVGAYNVVPLTAVVAEFEGWTRRMEWLWEVVAFMLERRTTTRGRKKGGGKGGPSPSPRAASSGSKGEGEAGADGEVEGEGGVGEDDGGDGGQETTTTTCTGAALIDRLRGELQTGYEDIEETARSLVRVAEMAWVKQVSAWILYGRLPGFGAEDFFIRKAPDADDVRTKRTMLRRPCADLSAGIPLRFGSAAVFRHFPDSSFDAVHRPLIEPCQGPEQS